MAEKNLYANDLIHRFPGHTFTETPIGSLIKVEFKDSSSTVISEATQLVVIDAYRTIRNDVLENETPAFLSTTTQRDALTDIDTGTIIFNITTLRIEIYGGTTWEHTPLEAYGSMYENNTSGSDIDETNKTWVTAAAGVLDGNGIITFVSDPTGDRLVIGTEGGGDYQVIAKCTLTNDGGGATFSTLTVQVNGVDTILQDEKRRSPFSREGLHASGILTLSDDDYLTLHVVSSTASNIITAYNTSLTIARL